MTKVSIPILLPRVSRSVSVRRRRGAATAWIPALALCVLLFTGCPQMLIERVEKILPPPGYNPRFNTSSVSLDSLAGRYKAALRSGTV
ncbi:MAG: hypothetical protein ACKOAG_00480, partial [Candidatus Kapaibacterium sp.]